MLLRFRAGSAYSSNSENKGKIPSYFSVCAIDRFVEHTFQNTTLFL